MKKVIILGVTGSIGENALNVLDDFKDKLEPVAFSAHSKVLKLEAVCSQYPKAKAVISRDNLHTKAAAKQNGWGCGQSALLDMIRECDADIVLNGIAGAAGLLPSLAALESGKDLALANKETMVVAGSLVKATARQYGGKILPVDSEHSAVFSLLEDQKRENVKEIILTASGGPFKNCSLEELTTVSVSDALKHPTWNMGTKITIDSASLANKGLEVIEACRLFDFDPSCIKVVVHPQSIVHSFIRLNDGALYAQMSRPSMVLPIQNALTWPEIKPVKGIELELDDFCRLEFYPPDSERFPMLDLAYRSLEKGELYPAVYNAANEIAVEAFRHEKISFREIFELTEYTMEQDFPESFSTLEEILKVDNLARQYASQKAGLN